MAVRVQRSLELDAASCYAAFCAVEKIPEWVDLVAQVNVETRDAEGRPEEVWFEVIEPAGGPHRYTLHYAYDPARHRVLWRPGRNADAGLHGVATFDSLDDETGCRLTYTIKLGDDRESTRAAAMAQAEAVADAFARWVQAAAE